jgi:hypothetical protein
MLFFTFWANVRNVGNVRGICPFMRAAHALETIPRDNGQAPAVCALARFDDIVGGYAGAQLNVTQELARLRQVAPNSAHFCAIRYRLAIIAVFKARTLADKRIQRADDCLFFVHDFTL